MKNEKLNEKPTIQEKINKLKEKRAANKKLKSEKELAKQEQINDEPEVEPKKTFWVQLRILPIWLRIILVSLLLAAVMVIGLRIGYSFIGDGNPEDVLKKETWTHILDIIKGKE